jgi:hypothetical protein
MANCGTFSNPVYGTYIGTLPPEYVLSTCGEGPGVCSGHTNYPENCSRTHQRLMDKVNYISTNTSGPIITCPIN